MLSDVFRLSSFGVCGLYEIDLGLIVLKVWWMQLENIRYYDWPTSFTFHTNSAPYDMRSFSHFLIVLVQVQRFLIGLGTPHLFP